MAKTASLAAMVTSLTTERDITNMVEARKAIATVAVRIITIEKGEKGIVLLIILVLIMERTVRREGAMAIARSVRTETVPIIMKEGNSVLLTILVLTTIMVDVCSVHTLLVSTTIRKEENSVHIVHALTMHSKVESSARIVLVLTTMADSRVDMVVHREVTVRVLPTTTRMQNIA
jgi:type II secretory pathway component PulK